MFWFGAKILDSVLYLPSLNDGFSLYNVANLLSPAVIHDYQSPTWNLSGVTANDTWAYATQYISPGNWGDALHVILLGDGTNPLHVTSVPSSANSLRAEMIDTKLAIAGGGVGMLLYDLSFPWVPVHTGTYSGASKHNFLTGDLAFTCADGISFDIYDVSDIYSPVLLADAHADRFSQYSIYQDGYVFVLEYDLYWSGPDPVSYLRVIDVSDPSNPGAVTELVLGIGDSRASCMTLDGNYMYTFLTSSDSALVIVDVANPAAPVIMGRYPLSGENPHSVHQWSHYIFVSYQRPNIVEMYDIAEPLNPTLVDFIQYPTRGWEMTTVGNQLLTSTDAGLYVHQINVPIICGDANFDGTGPDITDLLFIVSYLFGGGPEPFQLQSADVNGDGALNILDIIRIVDFLFASGLPLNCTLR